MLAGVRNLADRREEKTVNRLERSAGGLAAAIAILLLGIGPACQRRAPETIFFPPSTPERQGMDSRVLIGMFNFIEENRFQIHSVAILREDHVVLEAYFDPIRGDHVHHIGSSTKSFTSALIGIAIDRGFIKSVDQPVLTFFTNRNTANRDELKDSVTLEHLLTMSSGFDWPTVRFFERIGSEWSASGDAVQFVLDRPMIHEPGSRFNYNSGNAHVLSAVIQKTTGLRASEFAEKHLFEPLGISGVIWPSDRNGVSWGGGRMMMTTRDMLRFGYLFLKGGIFAGARIIPSGWIEASSSPRIDTFYEDDRYGYLWWVHPSGRYRSLGALGQCIYVIPKEEMVVAVTGGLGLAHMESLPDRIVDSFILPAIRATGPIPDDPEGYALLESRIESAASPEAAPIAPMPETARRITDRTIHLDDALIGARDLRFRFDASSAALHVPASGKGMTIGLDGVHRVSDAGPFGEPEALVGLKGRWEDGDSFSLHIVFLHGARFDTSWHFDETGVSVQVEEPLGSYRIRGALEAR